ncbi:acyloxyacyl hydrolase [Vibrio taketomensis]|uniref:acyloxyacyl hydrolase n=1 Tax=Vibrio taketomensis TaxID=2572923 RepID=UPI001E6194A0|nr:acyloxyacyl hydrolase [Vibrio taketomensis]
MPIRRTIAHCLLMTSLCSWNAYAFELLAGFGGGPQFGTDDGNTGWFLDAMLYDHKRSNQQWLSIGTGVTRIYTNSATGNSNITAISLFPELRLFTNQFDKVWFFHARALGPTYLNHENLGEREQASKFVFQAQVGAGVYLDKAKKYQLRLLYRHFSNANLDKPNDGLDIPLMLSLGIAF